MNDRTIFRRAKDRDNPYVMIDKDVFEATDLSWKAKGLMGYLLSRPDDWVVRMGDLVKRSQDGLTATRTAVNELITTGYIVRTREHGDKGHFTWVYEVHEIPRPSTENPSMVNPSMENQPCTNINSTENKGTKEGASAPLSSSPDGNDNEPFDDDGIFTYTMVDDSDERFVCPCGETVVIASLPKHRAYCQTCEGGLRVRWSTGGVRISGRKQQQTLGKLFSDCPDPFRNWRVAGGLRRTVMDAYQFNAGLLWDALNWSRNKIVKGEMDMRYAVKAGLSVFHKKKQDLLEERTARESARDISGIDLATYRPGEDGKNRDISGIDVATYVPGH